MLSRAGCSASVLAIACAGQPEVAEVQLPALPEPELRDLRDELVYQVLVDRFDDAAAEPAELADRPVADDLARIQGGDWQGLRRRLPYIRDLGMTAIWISPIFENVARYVDEDGYHGYWASDLTRLNPYFGQLEDLQQLVDSAHALKLKVFVDVAPNHLGQVFSYDLNADGSTGDGEMLPPFRNDAAYDEPLLWSHRPSAFSGRAEPTDSRSVPSPRLQRQELAAAAFHRRGSLREFVDPAEVELGDFPKGLRDLNTESEVVVSALVDSYAEWVRLTNVDGFRLDAVPHAGREFWTALCSRLRARLHELGRERFFIFGEVFRGEPQTLASYTGPGSMDSVLDFAFLVNVVNGYVLGGRSAASAVGALHDDRPTYRAEPQPGGIGLDPWQARLSFVDNHDTGRILGKLPDPYAAQLALTLAFTVDAIPVVYYGTEQGFDGKTQHAAREPMWWAGYGDGYPLHAYVRRLALLRRTHPALARGDLSVRYASLADGNSLSPDAGLLAFERTLDGSRVLVVSNAHANRTASASIPTGFSPTISVRNALEPRHARYLVEADGSVTVSLPPRTALVLVP